MDAQFINPFLVAVQSVFKTMLSIQMTMGKPSVKTTNLTCGEVTGIIGFAGDKKGTLSLAFSKETATFIYKSMTGEDTPAVNADVVDAVGELTNIISGQARVEIEKIGCKLNASLPTVIMGQDVAVNFITKLPVISLPFGFDADGTAAQIFVEFSFE
jgi:chemotaxis protein CheX